MDSQQKISSLQREIEEQKDYIMRLNGELRRYQLMGLQDQGGDLNLEEGIPPWAANTVFMSPLLVSYDARIAELESALGRAKQDLEALSENSRKLTTENTHLREEMEKKWTEMLSKEKQELEGGNLALAFYIEEKNEMQERLDLLSTENNMLLEQLDAFKERSQYLEKLSVDRSKTAEMLLDQLKQLSSEYNNLKMEDEEIVSHKEIAENKLKRVQESLGALEREREENVTVVNRLQNELRIAQQQSQYYKKAYEEVDMKKSEEIELLVQESHQAAVREKEVANKLVMYERESEEAREQANYYKREFEGIRNECDSMLKIMEDYEQKIATFQQKEDSIYQTVRESKQKVDEAFLERDRALLRENQSTRQLERLQEQLRTDLNEQKGKYETLVEGMRKKHTSLIAARDNEVSQALEKSNALEAQVDRLQRDILSVSSDKEKTENLMQEEQKRLDNRLADYERKMRETEELRLSEKRILDSQTQQYSIDRQEWDRVRKNNEHNLYNLTKELENAKISARRTTDDNRRLKGQYEDIIRERDQLVQELNTLRDSYYEKLNQASAEYNAKVNVLERQIQEAREHQKQSEEKTFHLLKAQERVAEKWKMEHHETVSYFEKVIQELNDEINRLSRRNRDLGDSVPIKTIKA